MNAPLIGSLFSGYGGLEMGVQTVLGGIVAWHCEIESAPVKVLAHHHPDVPNLGDITQVDWSPAEPINVLTGGPPCQDVSSAGRRTGIRPGTRSGLWIHMAYAIDRLRPELVVIENVRGLVSADAHCDVEPCPWCLGDDDEDRPLRAFGCVLGDLANLGYDARWGGLRAADVGAPHGRYRIFITAWPAADAPCDRWVEGRPGSDRDTGWTEPASGRSNAAPDADSVGPVRGGDAWGRRGGPAHHGDPAADTDSDGREGRQERHLRAEAGQPAPLGGDPAGHVLDWGDYEPAIRRWELILGRPAPAPTQTGKRGGQQLSPAFVEFMMGLPDGWVTAVPGLSRNEQLKMLGNGVVPQQCAMALRWLLVDAARQ